jgi:hypothetical protein
VSDGLECFCQLQPAVEVLGGSVGLLLQRAGDRLGGGIEFDPEVNRCRGHAASIVARGVLFGISTPRMMFWLAGEVAACQTRVWVAT